MTRHAFSDRYAPGMGAVIVFKKIPREVYAGKMLEQTQKKDNISPG